MKKYLVLFSMLCFCLCANAKGFKKDFNTIISESGIEKSSVAVSIKELNTSKTVFAQNERILMHPASIQKVLTLPSAIDVLGENYEFKTEIYSRGTDSYLIKLGADPYLTSKDLLSLVKQIDSKTVKQIYIDDSIVEAKDWGEGWQWDDDMNTYMPRFNAYNLDNNLIKITVMKSNDGNSSMVIIPSKYPLTFFNNIRIGESSKVKVTRDSMTSANTLTLDGTINKPVTLFIPSNNLKRYFDIKLTQSLADRNIYLKQPYIFSTPNSGDAILGEISNPIERGINDVLKHSKNMVSETIQKIAASKAYGEKGTDINGVKLFNAYCEKLGLDSSRIKIVDASGVSKNNLVYADFMTEYLIKNKDNTVLQKMATPGEGTLSTRMLLLKDNLRAKTGTLSDISSITGYLEAKSGKRYVFCIIVNDPISKDSDKKTLEDYIIRELYLKG